MNMQPVPLPQKGANSVGGYTSPSHTPTGLGADTSGPQGINSPLVGTPGNAGIEHLVGRCCLQMLVTGQKHCMHVGVRLTSYTLFSANTEDVPQTLHLQMTPMRSLSPRVRFWILLITMGNGGGYGEKTALLVVHRVAFMSLLLPRYWFTIAVAPSNHLQALGEGFLCTDGGGGPPLLANMCYRAKALYACECQINLAHSFFLANTEDVPQTPRLRVTPMRYLSPRVRLWILLMTTRNGGRDRKKMALLVVRCVTSTSLLLPLYWFTIAVMPSNYLQALGMCSWFIARALVYW